MKVLHTVPAYHPEGPGGIEVYVRELVLAQRAAGHQPVVLTGRAEPRPRPMTERREVDGIPVIDVHRDDLWFEHHTRAWHPGVEALVEQVVASERPDVLHVHHWLRLCCNLVEIAGRHGVPAIVTLHDAYSTCPRICRVRADLTHCTRSLSIANCAPCVPRWEHESEARIAAGIALFRDALRDELGRAHTVVVASHALAGLVAADTGLPAARMTVLPPCHAPRIVAKPSPAPGGNEPLRFATWGNLGRHKGGHVLLAAVRELVAAGAPRPFELHVFGRPESAEYALELDRLAAGMPVTRHGPYAFADLAACAPHCGVFPFLAWETFSFVLEECIGLGLPCIASGVGAIPERAGVGALLVPPGDPTALAAAMQDALRDPGLLGRLAARLPVPAPTADAHAAMLDELYHRALATGRHAAAPSRLGRRWREFLATQQSAGRTTIGPPRNVWVERLSETGPGGS